VPSVAHFTRRSDVAAPAIYLRSYCPRPPRRPQIPARQMRRVLGSAARPRARVGAPSSAGARPPAASYLRGVALQAAACPPCSTCRGPPLHVHRTLQALPHALGTARPPRRGRVEHFVLPIWMPDTKTAACMRCGKTFGRRRHCHWCGRCVCLVCSGMVGRTPPAFGACPG
jgi:hypothetical protein